MKNIFKLSSLLFVGLLLFQISCSDDPAVEPKPIPDVTGKWALTKATLVDGNALTPEADPLVIQNFTLDGENFFPLTVEVGDFEITTGLVGGALAATTCQNPANYATFFIELLAAGNALIFDCSVGEPGFAGQAGTWTVDTDTNGDYTILNLSVNLEGIVVPVQISIENLVVTSTQIGGTAVRYPMKKDFTLPISDDGNLQLLTTDIIFSTVL